MLYASKTKISARTRLLRQRVLPDPGQVLVEPGDRVESAQVVARTSLPDGLCIVAVARLLGVSASEVDKSLKIELGSTVHQGDVIARRGRFLGPKAVSPIDGIVTAMGGGRVLIESHPRPFELRAYISGKVLDVEGSQVVSIETSAALVQGIWGSGGESTGVLKLLTKKANDPLEAQTIDPACHGSILVVGTVQSRESLIRAQDVDARGVVAGSLSPDVLSTVGQLSFPLVITDGFGETPMMERVFTLLEENEGRQASISGRTKTDYNVQRPEVIIPLPNAAPAPKETETPVTLEAGTTVRVVRAPYAGRVGELIRIAPHARLTPTGARVRCAEVDIGQDTATLIPLANLDILY